MKMKSLLLASAMFVSIASFANSKAKIVNVPAWDKPLYANSMKFVDPYTVNYWCLEQGDQFHPPHRLQLYAELNTDPGVAWDVVLEVWGIWDSLNGNAGFKDFVVTVPYNSTFKMVFFNLDAHDQPDPNWCNYVSEGPH